MEASPLKKKKENQEKLKIQKKQKQKTTEKTKTGCFQWLRDNGTLEGKMEALDFVNEHYNEVKAVVKSMQRSFLETEKKLKEETFS